MSEPTVRRRVHVAATEGSPIGSVTVPSILERLLRTDSIASYSLRAWPVALVPSLALVVSGFAAILALGLEPSAFQRPSSHRPSFAASVVVGPLVETALLVLTLRLGAGIFKSRVALSAAAGVFWGVLHGVWAPLWFLGSAWAFFVFSYGYLAWRPISARAAWLAALLPHMLGNATGVAVLALDL